MANIMDYIYWRGDLSFTERPFNEVDSLILTEFCYAKLGGIVPGFDGVGGISVRDAYARYHEIHSTQPELVNDPAPVFGAMASSVRFGKCRLYAFVNEVNTEAEVQFSAVTLDLGDGTYYVAYRGTDENMVGWREDFNFSYQAETPGQSMAVAYLNRMMDRTAGRVRIGGHSKGGNLAIYAAAFCDESKKVRIAEVYSNDGPGFNAAIVQTPEYQGILPKVRLTTPESSLVGILLTNPDERKVVKSNAAGLMQHDPYTWQINRDTFDEAESQSGTSLFLNETFRRWLDNLDDDQKKEFITAVFDTLDAGGIRTTADLYRDKWVTYNAVLKAGKQLGEEKQKMVVQILKALAAAGRETLWDETRRSFQDATQKMMADIADATQKVTADIADATQKVTADIAGATQAVVEATQMMAAQRNQEDKKAAEGPTEKNTDEDQAEENSAESRAAAESQTAEAENREAAPISQIPEEA